MDRPIYPGRARRTVRLTMPLRPAELDLIEREAAHADLPAATLCRDLILEALRRREQTRARHAQRKDPNLPTEAELKIFRRLTPETVRNSEKFAAMHEVIPSDELPKIPTTYLAGTGPLENLLMAAFSAAPTPEAPDAPDAPETMSEDEGKE